MAPLWSKRALHVDDRLFDVRRDFGCLASGPLRLFLGPRGFAWLITGLPRIQPTFRAGHLATDRVDLVPGQIFVDGVLATLLMVCHHDLLGKRFAA
jgi:hypothetical protein